MRWYDCLICKKTFNGRAYDGEHGKCGIFCEQHTYIQSFICELCSKNNANIDTRFPCGCIPWKSEKNKVSNNIKLLWCKIYEFTKDARFWVEHTRPNNKIIVSFYKNNDGKIDYADGKNNEFSNWVLTNNITDTEIYKNTKSFSIPTLNESDACNELCNICRYWR